MLEYQKLLCCLLVVLPAALAVGWDETTPLDEYVNRPEPDYGYELLEIMEGEGFSVHVLNMTSLKWYDETWTHNPIWWHHLHVIIPDVIINSDAALFRISMYGYGYNVPDIDDHWLQLYGAFSVRTGSVSAIIKQDPNQPITFTDDPLRLPRVEDMIIAHTWKRYIESEEEFPDKEMIAQMPMVKSAKHGMDTVIAYANSVNPEINIDKYLPTGESKRGWVAWLLGCVDQRVFAMAPIVFDLLNFMEGLHYHNRCMGGWSWAFAAYWSEPITRYAHHPRTEEIGQVIDPLAYNERLTMPKLVSIATGDEFFIPSNSHLWWDELTGHPSNYMLVIENEDHSHNSADERILASTEALYMSTLKSQKIPHLTWQRIETETSGSIILETDTTPTLIQGWVADTTEETKDRRDFRLVIMGRIPGTFKDNPIEFVATPVEDLGDGQYRLDVDIRETGWRGFFIEACFDSPDQRSYCFTSEVQVVPDTLPFEECTTPSNCQGFLV